MSKKNGIRFNIVIVLLFALIAYVAFIIVAFFIRTRRGFYEVTEGSMVSDKEYTGLIFREEEVANTEVTGYVNFYMREGKRCAVGDNVFLIDETGNLNSMLASQGANLNKLDDANSQKLKKKLSDFSISYDRQSFYNVYDVKNDIDADLLEFSNLMTLENIDNITREKNINLNISTAAYSGIISYNIDIFEGKDINTLSEDDFDRSKYSFSRLKSGDLVDKNTPIYKIVSSDNWTIVFPLSEEDKEAYKDRTSLKVNFKTKGLTDVAAFSTFTGADSLTYGRLDFDKYMIHFLEDRFINFEIELSSATGLKIPHNSVVDVSFFTVPGEYLASNSDDVNVGFYREVIKNNKTSIEYLPTDIYDSVDGMLYISDSPMSKIHENDYLVQPDVGSKYKVGAKEKLKGVFNINKGYAIFKKVDILSSNEEYYIVKKNTKYGLSVYDHILLDTDGINEGDFIYR